MDWFSSDFHFGHANIAGPTVSNWTKGYRDFASLHEMNKTLTQTVNKYVKPDDTLYYLGDFAFGDHAHIPAYRHSLLCQNIHLIRGNHDKYIDKFSYLFLSINDVLLLKHTTPRIFLSHYAHRVWPHSHHGNIHLYGHSHAGIPDYGKSMDVGVDAAYKLYGEYRPFSLLEIYALMNTQQNSIHHP